MDDETRFHVILADGTEFDADDDRAGNMILTGEIEEEALSADNLTMVQISVNGAEAYTVENQVLRAFYRLPNGRILIRISEMNDLERIVADYSAKLDYIACMAGVDLDE